MRKVRAVIAVPVWVEVETLDTIATKHPELLREKILEQASEVCLEEIQPIIIRCDVPSLVEEIPAENPDGPVEEEEEELCACGCPLSECEC